MDGHLQSSRKLAVRIGAVALSLLLGACGGGGGGGGGGIHPASGRVIRIIDQDTEDTTTADTLVPAQPQEDQASQPPDPGTRPTTPPNTDTSPQELGIATLRWKAPSQRVDGQSLPMSEIAGYRIYYGATSGDYDSVLSVDDPYTFTIQIESLPVGTYYFVMTTLDTNGMESSYSHEAAKNVDS